MFLSLLNKIAQSPLVNRKFEALKKIRLKINLY